MLKRLELIGFKSFAEKTHFDFGPGITAVVGPNGSGKSNVVDAVRWIMGEQSAKSLRGGEMADVIFNGSSSRRGLGMAEVSLYLDNSRRSLSIDMDEVQVTRRVYRDGEGEYLINKQPARLKDIKDLFLGSGAGADAYSIIEQGRVDVLLQASTKERRTIFEEAAGISRFKAKKVETLRKLEHVEQNLTRLRDIIEEVERQLRSVKLQAAKAQRYQEYTERLKQLRVAISLDEYHQLSQQLQQVMAALESLRANVADHAQQAAHWEADIQRLELAITEIDITVRRHESALASARERIAGEEANLAHERTRTANLEQDLAQTRSHVQSFSRQLAAMAEAMAGGEQECADADHQCEQCQQASDQLETALAETTARLAELRERIQADKVELMEQMRLAARHHNQVVSLKAQTESLAQHRRRLQDRNSQATQTLSQLGGEVHELSLAEEKLQAQLDASRNLLADLRRQREEARQASEMTGQQLSYFREQRSGLASRIQVLEGLEQSYEGLSTGVREVLQLIAQVDASPWRTVAGLVADLLTVPREHAALIDLALGDRSQYCIVRDPEMLAAALKQHATPFTGRVSFMGYQPASASASRTIPDHPGIVTSAAKLVSCTHPELAELPEQLLGSTLVVKELAVAREIALQTNGYRFITLQGELLEADGTLTVGQQRADAGILSRKSELRELRNEAQVLDQQIQGMERKLAELRETLGKLDTREEEGRGQMEMLTGQTADLRSRLQQQRERHEGLSQEVQLSQDEIQQLDEELVTLQKGHQEAVTEAQAADRRVQELQSGLEGAEAEIQSLEQQRHDRQRACTEARVALATAQERRNSARARHQRTQQEWRQRQDDQQQQQEHLATVEARLQESRVAMLLASSAQAQAYVDKEQAERHIAQLQREADALRHERQQHQDQAHAARQTWQAAQEQVHARELEASDLQHRRDNLAARLREEHELDLVELYRNSLLSGGRQPSESGSEAQRAESETQGAYAPRSEADAHRSDSAQAQDEIAELKRKISRLGSVSLDALQELQELETRATTLQAQHDDLMAAKKSLDEIIGKINEDSRRLFGDTFSTIRGHFQELFRKLFGGGMADIVLEDETDILESGIEVIARPPGKELRSISLMSGGEKTLTAVALLLAIFRSKPSPFCILDEVDAALDEANIGRYTAVLSDFLDQSQFIIITHSKKTMAAADILYGVTMQESGVSKRVAIRFEDWPEDAQPAVIPATDEDEITPPAEEERAESAA